jgi:hypothetical protein
MVMTEQLALMLAAASFGFVSAVFFCIGNVFNSAKEIMLQSTPFWNFNESLARAITAQRAQYVVGALLLVASFLLQVAAALAPSSTPAGLPQWLQPWPILLLTILVPTGIVAGVGSALFYSATIRKVLRLSKEFQ